MSKKEREGEALIKVGGSKKKGGKKSKAKEVEEAFSIDI